MQAPIAKVKRDLGKLIDRVERGESVVILRHGAPVARIVPMPGRGKPWRIKQPDHSKLYRGLNLDAPILEEI